MTLLFVYLSNFYIIFSLTKYICYDNWVAKMPNDLLLIKKLKIITLSILLSKYPTRSQVTMIKWVAVNWGCNGKALLICIFALSSKACDVLGRYQTSPVLVVSTSAQNGATKLLPPPNGNEFWFGTKLVSTLSPKKIAPSILTYKMKYLWNCCHI